MEDNGCAKYTEAEWAQYAGDVVSETIRETMETHMLDCAHCLDAYTVAIETQMAQGDEQATAAAGAKAGTVAIMAYIASSVPLSGSNQPARPSFFRSTLAHYLIAASITLLLVSSGAFDWFTSGSQVFAAQQEAVSIASEWPHQWLTKARGWIGGWTHMN